MFTSGPTVHMCLQSISRSFDNMVREGGEGSWHRTNSTSKLYSMNVTFFGHQSLKLQHYLTTEESV